MIAKEQTKKTAFRYTKDEKIIIDFDENSESIPKRKNIWIASTKKVLKSEDFLFQSAYALKGMSKFLTKNERKEYETIDKFLYDNVTKYVSTLSTTQYVGNYKFDKSKYMGRFMKNLICYQGMLETNEIKFLFLKILSCTRSDKIQVNINKNNDNIFDFLQASRGVIIDTNPDLKLLLLI
jgi:hypothetical protein